jgi:hypothetical protein
VPANLRPVIAALQWLRLGFMLVTTLRGVLEFLLSLRAKRSNLLMHVGIASSGFARLAMT